MFNDPTTENNGQNQNAFLEILLFTSPFNARPKLESHLLETIKKRKLPIKITKIDVLRDPEAAEKHDIIVCPTLIFRNFMKVHGNCEEGLEELISYYLSLSTSEFQYQSVNSSVGG